MRLILAILVLCAVATPVRSAEAEAEIAQAQRLVECAGYYGAIKAGYAASTGSKLDDAAKVFAAAGKQLLARYGLAPAAPKFQQAGIEAAQTDLRQTERAPIQRNLDTCAAALARSVDRSLKVTLSQG